MSSQALTAQRTPMTAEDLLNLPEDDLRHELVRGELRMMTPAGFEHGETWKRLMRRLDAYVEERQLGAVTGPDVGFIISRDPDTVRAPDLAFVTAHRIADAEPITGYFPGTPDLAVEVISPSDTLVEVEEKVHDYLSAGTRLVWVINPRQQTATIYRPGPEVRLVDRNGTLDGGDIVPGFTCRVGELFAGQRST